MEEASESNPANWHNTTKAEECNASLTNAQRRKNAESFFFERAQASLTCWPHGAVDATGEEPDIVVESAEGRYGVEVTEMLRGEVRAVEETRRLICEKARRLFGLDATSDGLDVKVIFRADAVLNPRDQDRAAAELVTIIRSWNRQIRPAIERVRLEDGTDFDSQLFVSVWLHHHPSYPSSRWQPVGAWWVPTASPEQVQATIDSKERKVAAYRRRVSDVWLLIVLQGFRGSASWSVDDTVFTHSFRSTFDGVVLLDNAINKAYPLLARQS